MQTHRISIVITALIMTLAIARPVFADVYLVIYATYNGETGHAGIAVDNYNVFVEDKDGIILDTVANGLLTYYDLWPKNDAFDKNLMGEDVEPRYFKLPRASSEGAISLTNLYHEGIPHREGYPSDGILRIPSTPDKDHRLIIYLDSLIASGKPFNVRSFNCADLAAVSVTFVTGVEINAREFIPFNYSTTPNKLFREVLEIDNVTVIKDPGAKILGSFVDERILKHHLRQKDNHVSINQIPKSN